MIAEVGGMENVSGSRMATPLAPPSPGSTPMMVPSAMPMTARPEVVGLQRDPEAEEEVLEPHDRSVPQPRLERALGHRHQEPLLEHHERDDRERTLTSATSGQE